MNVANKFIVSVDSLQKLFQMRPEFCVDVIGRSVNGEIEVCVCLERKRINFTADDCLIEIDHEGREHRRRG